MLLVLKRFYEDVTEAHTYAQAHTTTAHIAKTLATILKHLRSPLLALTEQYPLHLQCAVPCAPDTWLHGGGRGNVRQLSDAADIKDWKAITTNKRDRPPAPTTPPRTGTDKSAPHAPDETGSTSSSAATTSPPPLFCSSIAHKRRKL
jgi:hypothetical protein